MKNLDLDSYLELAITASELAGDQILLLYNSNDIFIEYKEDRSPLTIADTSANKTITQLLAQTGLPILSEEGKDILWEERSKWDLFWMVDPLDGTKEFINKTGEFTVNISLIERNISILGVVYVPVSKTLYWAKKAGKSYKREKDKHEIELTTKKVDFNKNGIRIVASRNHLNADTTNFINQFEEPVYLSMGSSLKFLKIAEGEADIYPRFAPTMEWDTAASQVILEQAGGSVIGIQDGKRLTYNKRSLLNSYFIARS